MIADTSIVMEIVVASTAVGGAVGTFLWIRKKHIAEEEEKARKAQSRWWNREVSDTTKTLAATSGTSIYMVLSQVPAVATLLAEGTLIATLGPVVVPAALGIGLTLSYKGLRHVLDADDVTKIGKKSSGVFNWIQIQETVKPIIGQIIHQ